MLNDFRRLGKLLASEEKTLYVMPEYLAILANRQSTKIVYGVNREQAHATAKFSAVDYVYLTHLHPRKTRMGFSGMKSETLEGWTRLEWCSYDEVNAIKVSCLYKVIK